jgi:hypothetical protein
MNVHWFIVVVILLMYFIYKFNETLISWVILVEKIAPYTNSNIIFHCYFLHVVIQNLPRFELLSMCCERRWSYWSHLCCLMGILGYIHTKLWKYPYNFILHNFEMIYKFYTSSHVCMLISLINAYFDCVSVSQVLVILKYETISNKLIVVNLVPIWWTTLVYIKSFNYSIEFFKNVIDTTYIMYTSVTCVVDPYANWLPNYFFFPNPFFVIELNCPMTKKYSNFNISCTLGLKFPKSPSLNPTHKGLSNNAKSATKFPHNLLNLI